jgi:hypothetical protein
LLPIRINLRASLVELHADLAVIGLVPSPETELVGETAVDSVVATPIAVLNAALLDVSALIGTREFG